MKDLLSQRKEGFFLNRIRILIREVRLVKCLNMVQKQSNRFSIENRNRKLLLA